MFSNYDKTKDTLTYQRAKPLKSSKDGLPIKGSGDANSQLELAKIALIDTISAENKRNNQAAQYFLDKSYKWVKYAMYPRVRGYKGLDAIEKEQALAIENGINHRVSKIQTSPRTLT
jgi:hypothetical protein